MQWRFSQSSGHIDALENGVWKLKGLAYAGRGAGLLNPAMDGVHDVGPLPKGTYTLQFRTDVPHLGPRVFFLAPAAANDMKTRGEFFIHWARSGETLMTSSSGCIVPVTTFLFDLFQHGDEIEVY